MFRFSLRSFGTLLLALSVVSYSQWAAAQLTEAPLTNTSQIIAPDGVYPNVLAALNARYSTQGFAVAPNNVNGVLFQNFDWLGGAQVITGGTSLTYAPNFADNTGRGRAQNTAGTISGTNDTVLESIANSIAFYAAGDTGTFTFSNLPANRAVKVQLIGGDDGGGFNNWNGKLAVTVNGNSVGTWNAGTDPNNLDAKIATFTGTTTGAGTLTVAVNQTVAGNHAGIAGALVLGAGPTTGFSETSLTNTVQLGVSPNSPSKVVAAGDLRFAGQAATPAGNANGITFTSVDFLGVGAQPLGGSVAVTVAGPAGDRSRSQNTAASISGPGDTVLEGVANTINFLGGGDNLTLTFSGLSANSSYELQLIGGDAGGNLGNWRGDFDVSVNGGPNNLWNAGDDLDTSATLAQVLGLSNGSGVLQVSLTQRNAGQFAGLGGFVLVQTPEPAALALWAIAGLGLATCGWRLRRRASR